MPQFEIESYPSLIFWFLISFIWLLILLRKKTIPSIGGLLKARKDLLQTNHKKAEGYTKIADDSEQSTHRKKQDKEQESLLIINKEKSVLENILAQKVEDMQNSTYATLKDLEAELKEKEDEEKPVFDKYVNQICIKAWDKALYNSKEKQAENSN